MNNLGNMSVSNVNQKVIDLTRIPSIMSENPHERVGEHYEFIPTIRVAEILKEKDWLPVKAYEVNVRKEDRRGFQKHLIRFRHFGGNSEVKSVGDLFPEIVMTNSHDGTAAYVFMYGIFRLVCSNGMIVADSMFESFKVRHQGFHKREVFKMTREISESAPTIMNRVNEFRQIELDVPEQLVMAQSALVTKYDEEKAKDFDFERLMLPMRSQDSLSNSTYKLERNSLWNATNILQEKLVEKGGKFAHKMGRVSGNVIGLKKARPVTAITENVRLNKALWLLAENMAKLKAA